MASPPWARLQREDEGGAVASSVVSLRAPLADLSLRWEARVRDRLPFQYAVGISHWRRVTLAVGSGVLCPRPETEQLVDLAAAAFREMAAAATTETEKGSSPPLSSLPWADLGTGSGAIAVGLALDALVIAGEEKEERRRDSGRSSRENSDGDGASTSTSTSILSSPSPSVSPPRVFAVDASPLAASWARLNVSRLGLEKRVTVLEGSWLEPLFEQEARRTTSGSPPASQPPAPSAFLAGVVSNPPYIPRAQLPTLQREVRDHEPTLALDGGPGAGLDSLRPLCASAARALACGGFLALETAGREQALEVASDLLKGSGAFEDTRVHEDLFGVARFVTAKRRQRKEK